MKSPKPDLDIFRQSDEQFIFGKKGDATPILSSMIRKT